MSEPFNPYAGMVIEEDDGNLEYIVVLRFRLNEEQLNFTEWMRHGLGLEDTEELTVLAVQRQDFLPEEDDA